MSGAILDAATPGSLADARAAIADARAILLDWDGCVAFDNRLTPPAIAFMQAHCDRIAILSNNSTHLPADFARLLAIAGIDIPIERIILAGAEAIALAAAEAPAPALVLSDRRIRAHARAVGVQLDRTDPEIVVLLRDRRFSYPRLETAANALARGARLIVANADTVHPGPGGTIVPETGALLAALLTCVDVAPERIRIVGKPAPDLFLKACAALDADPRNAIMIGDNPDTDIRGATAMDMGSILLAPGGEVFFETLMQSAKPGQRRLRSV
jgi:4-nitrophenyl phosphatase